MKKTIKLFLVLSLLFSIATYHQQARAGTISKTISAIVTTAVIGFIVYSLIDNLSYMPNERNNPGRREDKKKLKRIIQKIDNTALKINYIFKNNWGLDINKYRKKVSNTLSAIGETLADGFFEIILTKEQLDRRNTEKLKWAEYKIADDVQHADLNSAIENVGIKTVNEPCKVL